jgi:hypothetical protein
VFSAVAVEDTASCPAVAAISAVCAQPSTTTPPHLRRWLVYSSCVVPWRCCRLLAAAAAALCTCTAAVGRAAAGATAGATLESMLQCYMLSKVSGVLCMLPRITGQQQVVANLRLACRHRMGAPAGCSQVAVHLSSQPALPAKVLWCVCVPGIFQRSKVLVSSARRWQPVVASQ